MFASFTCMFVITLFWPVLHHMFLLVFLLLVALFAYLFVWKLKSASFLLKYRSFARGASFLYLVLQAMSLVDMSFTFHDWLIRKVDETNVSFPFSPHLQQRYRYTDKTCCCANQFKSLYITVSLLFGLLSLGGCISLYFSPPSFPQLLPLPRPRGIRHLSHHHHLYHSPPRHPVPISPFFHTQLLLPLPLGENKPRSSPANHLLPRFHLLPPSRPPCEPTQQSLQNILQLRRNGHQCDSSCHQRVLDGIPNSIPTQGGGNAC